MKKISCLVVVICMLWATVALAAETKEYQINVTANDIRKALKQAEEQSLRQAIGQFMKDNEVLQYGTEIKTKILGETENFTSSMDIVSQETQDSENNYTVKVTVDMAALKATIDSFKSEPTTLGALQKLAASGDPEAQFKLGVMYADGIGAKQNYTEAIKWYQAAVEQRYSRALNNLGVMYDTGTGVKHDYVEATKWFRAVAEQGQADAQSDLGLMYSNGTGVKQDYAEAIKWFRAAAEQGHAIAQINLGAMYYNGEGVSKDKASAKRWFKKAAAQGNPQAQKNLDDLW